MKVRRILDVITDVLTLLALAIAGVGHFLPWFEIQRPYRERGEAYVYDYHEPGRSETDFRDGERRADAGGRPSATESLEKGLPPVDFQMWHAARSGIALAVAALLVGISLTLDLGLGVRKLLVFLMFVSVLMGIGFQVMLFTPYAITEAHRQFAASNWRETETYFVALIPSIIACALCLVRMGWTMPISAEARPPQVDREPLRNV